MKLFLKQHQSPGDILMLTAAVRDLKKSHPDIRINCETTAQQLWDNNPYLDRSIIPYYADRVIDMHYPLIHRSTQGAYHFIHGFRLYLQQELGIRIESTDFCVDVHLSEEQKHDPYIQNIVDNKPFWIIDAGYKSDFTCKMWQFARFQEVVNRTKDKIRWIQIGARQHNHRILDNVINLVGMTTHRQFINLMWRCSGVLTPVSYPMHLATMQWKDHPDGKRPCVVIAGSRQPSVWQQYTCHQYIHNCGALSCSRKGSCWKSRIVKLNDGSRQDNSICMNPVTSESGQIIPKCLDMISVDQVVRRIQMFL